MFKAGVLTLSQRFEKWHRNLFNSIKIKLAEDRISGALMKDFPR